MPSNLRNIGLIWNTQFHLTILNGKITLLRWSVIKKLNVLNFDFTWQPLNSFFPFIDTEILSKISR